jgi:AcrR family transcriptional regulator
MTARAKAAAQTREHLLAAAWQQFATHAYEDVRLREIAARAGVTPQTLHTAFGSKEALLAAAFMWWGEKEVSRRETAPVGQARQAIRNLYDRYETDGTAILRMLAQEERVPAIRQMTDAGRAYHRDWVAHTFQPLLQGLRGANRERRLTTIVVATDLLVWKLLRLDMGLSRGEAEQAAAEMIQRPIS